MVRGAVEPGRARWVGCCGSLAGPGFTGCCGSLGCGSLAGSGELAAVESCWSLGGPRLEPSEEVLSLGEPSGHMC